MAHQDPVAAHLGKKKTEMKLRQHFYWPSLGPDVREMCTTCPECQKGAKKNRKRAPLQPFPIIDEPFRRIAIDIVGPLKRTNHGNKFILTMIDYATKYPKAVPLRKTDAKTVADALCQVGIPEEILSDQGSNFVKADGGGLQITECEAYPYLTIPSPNRWHTRKVSWHAEGHEKDLPQFKDLG